MLPFLILAWSLVCFCLPLGAQSLTITSGASPNQVFQRGDDGRAIVKLQGFIRSLSSPNLQVHVLGKNGPLEGLEAKPVDTLTANQWSVTLALPTGGPYRLEVRAGDVLAAVENILVGDLWVLAGQSNMEGYGDLIDVEQPHGLVHSFDMTDRWVLAEEPLHLLVNAADRVHWRLNAQKQPEKLEGQALASYLRNRKKGAGLGLPFATAMVKRTGVPVGLIPCAHGGTSMDQWSPELRDKAGDSLYGATIRRIRAVGGKVRGILWYQGESDANPRLAPQFQEKFERLVAAFRADTAQPQLPFYYVQIGRFINDSNIDAWNLVQEMQRQAESRLAPGGMVAAVDTSLDDLIHVSTGDLKRLGIRLANLACKDLGAPSCRDFLRGPRLESVQASGNLIRLTFSQVNGQLRSTGRISGFSLHDASGKALPLIYKAEFGAPNELLLHLITKPPEGATLRYGAGKDPYCNITDQRDMALPAFGPLPVEIR
ncbi:MAG: sialate O-acetylesterase [Bryobacteraceae bacterium]|nr:sialate O-acetylesterase [Bryobacteraceae bacterium]MDW8378122.1 sialate O-acetylesterase [Bryobacterales bacterium]